MVTDYEAKTRDPEILCLKYFTEFKRKFGHYNHDQFSDEELKESFSILCFSKEKVKKISKNPDWGDIFAEADSTQPFVKEENHLDVWEESSKSNAWCKVFWNWIISGFPQPMDPKHEKTKKLLEKL